MRVNLSWIFLVTAYVAACLGFYVHKTLAGGMCLVFFTEFVYFGTSAYAYMHRRPFWSGFSISGWCWLVSWFAFYAAIRPPLGAVEPFVARHRVFYATPIQFSGPLILFICVSSLAWSSLCGGLAKATARRRREKQRGT